MEKAEPTASERGLHLHHTCNAAVKMITKRLVIEKVGLALIDLPYCADTEAGNIEMFLPQAKLGFAQAVKTNWLYPSQITPLVRTTTPLTIKDIWQHIKLTEHQNALLEWHHFLATISYLTQLGQVTFGDFVHDTNTNDFYLDFHESHWHSINPSPETIWFLMEELETLTRSALYNPESMGDDKLLKVGHFFAAGEEISRIFA